MNVELLRKIQTQIVAHPEHFDMREWFAVPCQMGVSWRHLSCEDFKTESIKLETMCGTTECIAGWALTVANGGEITPESLLDIEGKAGRLLNLTPEQVDNLFFVREIAVDSGWPMDLSDKYARASTPAEKAAVAVERIERFIQTEGRE